jgi:hypothetical protein
MEYLMQDHNPMYLLRVCRIHQLSGVKELVGSWLVSGVFGRLRVGSARVCGAYGVAMGINIGPLS